MAEALITKKAIAEGLKEALKTKSFDKVSIADITAHCGLNRQTFYYHFQDKYELLTWIYYGELFQKVTTDITFDNWHLKIREMLNTMKEEHSFYSNTVRRAGECFSEYLYGITKTLFAEAVESLDENVAVPEEEKDFIAGFFAYGVCGVVLKWIQDGMKEATEQIADNLKMIARDSEKLAYNRYMEAADNSGR